MNLLKDPIILVLLYLIVVCLFAAINPRRRREMWLFILTVLLFALPRAGGVVSGLHLPLPLASVLSAVFITEWLLFRRVQGRVRSHLDYFFLAYAAVAGLGLAVGLASGGNHLVALIELCLYLFTMGLYFYASETFRTPHHFRLFCRWLLVISVCVSLYGIAQKFLGSRILINHVTYNSTSGLARTYIEVEPAFRRVLSSYGDPNVLAGQLLVFTAVALALVVGRGIPGTVRLGCLAVLILNVICAVYTGSRAGLLCLLLVVVGVLVWRSRWALLLLATLPLAAWYLLPEALHQLLPHQFQLVWQSSDLRYQFPLVAWRLLQATPFGCGFGNTILMQLHGANWSFEIIPGTVIWAGFNSFWLNLFSRMGLPGLTAFILLLGALFTYVARHVRYVQDDIARAAMVGGLVGFLGQTVIWLVNNTYMLPGGGLNFWFTMGMLVAACRAYAPMVDPVGARLLGVTWPTVPTAGARGVSPGVSVVPPAPASSR